METSERLAESCKVLNELCEKIDLAIADMFGRLTIAEIVGVLEVTKANVIKNALFEPEEPNGNLS